MTELERILRRELRKAGVPTYREVSHGSHRIGPVHAGRRKVSFSQVAGIEVHENRDGSGIQVSYNKGWKNDQVHTAEQIAEFLAASKSIVEKYNLVAEVR